MYPEKPLTSSFFTAVLSSMSISSLAALYFWGTDIDKTQLNLHDVWDFAWTYGIADRNSNCGLSMDCRLNNFKSLIEIPAIKGHLLLVFVASIIGGLTAFRYQLRHTPIRETVQTIRGTHVLYDADGRCSIRGKLGRSGKIEKRNLWLMPYVQLSDAAESFYTMLLGDHGSGKTGILRGWLEQILQHDYRLVIHCAKGDLTAELPDDDFILSAVRDDRGWCWEPGPDIRNRQDAAEFSAKFINPATTGETIWQDSARSVLTGLIESLRNEHGANWTWQQLNSQIFQSAAYIRQTLEANHCPEFRLIMDESDGHISRTSQSILLTLWIAALTTILPFVALSERTPKSRRFSISEWLSPDSKLPSKIVLQNSSEHPNLSTAINGVIVELIAGKVLSATMPKRSSPWLYLVLDELPVLKKLNRLTELLSVGREKGVRCISAVQDWDQVIKVYGEEDAKTLEARFKIKVVCQLGISETRDRVVEKFGGTRTIVEWDLGTKGQPPIRRESKISVIQPHQLSDELGVQVTDNQLQVRVAIFGLGYPVIVNIPLTSWIQRRPAHVSPTHPPKEKVREIANAPTA